MRSAARAIIIKDDALLVTHRNKFGMEYDILVGGGVDFGETLEQALYRELAEETGVQVTNPRLVFIEHAGDPYGTQYVFVCDYVSGEPALSQSSMEYAINAMGQNLYEPKWLPLKDLPAAMFRSERLKQAILTGIKRGWPTEPLDITA
ncbi:MAG TPA: NUDIX domain-containing protein [Candidatus Saccharimonadales bacterium]